MAKGRRLTTTLTERYFESYPAGAGAGHSHADASDFSEEDVWSTFDGNSHAAGGEWGPRAGFDESGGTTSSRVVHQLRRQDGVVLGARRQRQMATSAPLSVPDWGNAVRVDSVESTRDSDEFESDSGVDPPHEYLARSRRAGATSVFEGVGRTLKGRDMSRLRDAVWSRTGFNG